VRRLAAFSLVALMLLGDCQLLRIARGPRSLPRPQPEQIVISNGTTLDLSLFVNGTKVLDVPAKGGDTLGADRLPSLPWSVEARTVNGRVVAAFSASEADLKPTRGDHLGVQWTIPGDRVDLSCGMLVMWAGDHPIAGPPPGPGAPGDCQP
jgi:hypothetical protein